VLLRPNAYTLRNAIFGVSFFLALRLTAPLIQWRAAQNPNMSGNNQYITSNNLRRIAVGLD